jgi:mxaA protein
MKREVFVVMCFFAAAGLVAQGTARAQAPSVALLAPRPYGYFPGDVISHEAEIVVDRRFRLDPASAPKPGPRAYWLDLRAVEVRENADGGLRRYRLRLEYQTFYAPLETRRLEIPAFVVSLADGEAHIRAEIPAWAFLASPLREIMPPKGEGGAHLRPDVRPAPVNTAGARGALGVSTSVLLLALATLAHGRAWPPFHRRRDRPFARAARALARASRRPVDDAAYGAALLALHRAFDAAAGRRLFADDVDRFLLARPAFERLKPGVERFFAASRRAFFSARIPEAMAFMPMAEVVRLGALLRAAERRAR